MGSTHAADSDRLAQAISRRLVCVAVLAVVVAAGGFASIARADGDPASDVLVSQTMFVPSDASVSALQRERLQRLLVSAGDAGFPIRVAVIPSGYDLGSVTALWRKPRTYARFLGIELSIVHRQPLLVVMPNGFGFSWPGHSTAAAYRLLARMPIGSGGVGLLTAAGAAVRTLAAAEGGTVASVARPANAAASHRSSHETIVIIAAAAAALLAALAAGLILRRSRRSHPATAREPAIRGRPAFPIARRWAVPGVAVLCCVATGAPILALSLLRSPPATRVASATRAQPVSALATPYTWRAGQRRAPDFRLSDQNGRPVSLAAFRGRPVIVTFIDPLCRNFCPLAAHVLNQADRALPAAQRPVIIAVSVDIYADSRADLTEDFHRWDLVSQWRWAVGDPRALASVWRRYHVGVSVKTKRIAGTTVHFITHDEVAFIIDRAGYVRALYGWPYYPRDVDTAVKRLASS